MFLYFVFLDIATMFTAVAISYGPLAVVRLAARTDRTETVRGVVAAGKPLGVAIPVLYVVGGLLGLAAAIVSSVNLLAPWLVIAYVLWLVAMVIGARLTAPWLARVGEAAVAAPDGPIGGSLQGLLADPRFRAINVIDVVIVTTIVFDMVVKPFG